MSENSFQGANVRGATLISIDPNQQPHYQSQQRRQTPQPQQMQIYNGVPNTQVVVGGNGCANSGSDNSHQRAPTSTPKARTVDTEPRAPIADSLTTNGPNNNTAALEVEQSQTVVKYVNDGLYIIHDDAQDLENPENVMPVTKKNVQLFGGFSSAFGSFFNKLFGTRTAPEIPQSQAMLEEDAPKIIRNSLVSEQGGNIGAECDEKPANETEKEFEKSVSTEKSNGSSKTRISSIESSKTKSRIDGDAAKDEDDVENQLSAAEKLFQKVPCNSTNVRRASGFEKVTRNLKNCSHWISCFFAIGLLVFAVFLILHRLGGKKKRVCRPATDATNVVGGVFTTTSGVRSSSEIKTENRVLEKDGGKKHGYKQKDGTKEHGKKDGKHEGKNEKKDRDWKNDGKKGGKDAKKGGKNGRNRDGKNCDKDKETKDDNKSTTGSPVITISPIENPIAVPTTRNPLEGNPIPILAVETTATPVETTAARVETTAAPVQTTTTSVESTAARVETTATPVVYGPQSTSGLLPVLVPEVHNSDVTLMSRNDVVGEGSNLQTNTVLTKGKDPAHGDATPTTSKTENSETSESSALSTIQTTSFPKEICEEVDE